VAFQRFGDHRDRALAGPVLRDREGEALECSLTRIGCPVEGAASRIINTVVASDSTAMSARTLTISGCSLNTRPNALRCAV
jgi:hypothetical protein